MSCVYASFQIVPTTRSINEPRHEKTCFLHHAKTKAQISSAIIAQLISAFVFATKIVKFVFFLNLNFKPLSVFCGITADTNQAGRKRKDMFSRDAAHLKKGRAN